MNKEHCCIREECKCPKCGGALYYSELANLHACENIECRWQEEDALYKAFRELMIRNNNYYMEKKKNY